MIQNFTCNKDTQLIQFSYIMLPAVCVCMQKNVKEEHKWLRHFPFKSIHLNSQHLQPTFLRSLSQICAQLYSWIKTVYSSCSEMSSSFIQTHRLKNCVFHSKLNLDISNTTINSMVCYFYSNIILQITYITP